MESVFHQALGTFSLRGVGGAVGSNNYGITFIIAGSTFTPTTGDISLWGFSGTGDQGIFLDAGTTTQSSSGAHDLTIVSDTFSLNGLASTTETSLTRLTRL